MRKLPLAIRDALVRAQRRTLARETAALTTAKRLNKPAQCVRTTAPAEVRRREAENATGVSPITD
jgi:hypothetical protein